MASKHTNEEDADADVVAELPPPSQSHFAKFENLAPNDEQSWIPALARARARSSIPGSAQLRCDAMGQELKLHYFSQSQDDDDDETEEDAQFTGEDLELKG
ncbi:hypothetical protein B0T24DRAFT_712470 [Lasiosphaeria ovina]|uniref:Uncharacterized protein n=1 Tax=Lasiosphaeria ovina TaxID=92902 RepID=A0AAE0JV57_9PEZI|nr:hypothetical protein B0T24DRAFT_712470 [Lasiosphaeria ovina]